DVEVIVRKGCNLSFDDEVLIIEAVLASALRPPEQPQVIGRVMTAVPDPSAHEDGPLAEQKAIDVARRLFQDAADFVDQFGSEPLIGVQMQNPFGLNRQIALCPVPL